MASPYQLVVEGLAPYRFINLERKNMDKGYDTFIDDFIDANKKHIINSSNNQTDVCRCFFWNINNPSIIRARQQVLWLRQFSFDVLILTETKNSKGCNFFEQYFKSNGFHVFFPKPEGNEYGTLIISRFPFEINASYRYIKYLPSRVVSIKLLERLCDLEIVGVYVPSRDESDEKKERKRRFLEYIVETLKLTSPHSSFMFCGDFNVVEPDHVPHYSKFKNWEYDFYNTLGSFQLKDAFRVINPTEMEYSWVGRTGDGYRYDHCFVSLDLVPLIKECYYIHEPRIKKLSDHSGLVITLQINGENGETVRK